MLGNLTFEILQSSRQNFTIRYLINSSCSLSSLYFPIKLKPTPNPDITDKWYILPRPPYFEKSTTNTC